MVVISLTRFRREWIPWLKRFLVVMGLIYILSAAYALLSAPRHPAVDAPIPTQRAMRDGHLSFSFVLPNPVRHHQG